MILLIQLIGAVIAAFGIVGVFMPKRFGAMANFWVAPGRVYFGAAIRFALGALLIWAAPQSRSPAAVRLVGWIVVAAAIVTAMIPQPVVVRMAVGFAGLKPNAIRAIGVVAIGVGALLIYAAL
jgi:hypothetical protein